MQVVAGSSPAATAIRLAADRLLALFGSELEA